MSNNKLYVIYSDHGQKVYLIDINDNYLSWSEHKQNALSFSIQNVLRMIQVLNGDTGRTLKFEEL